MLHDHRCPSAHEDRLKTTASCCWSLPWRMPWPIRGSTMSEEARWAWAAARRDRSRYGNPPSTNYDRGDTSTITPRVSRSTITSSCSITPQFQSLDLVEETNAEGQTQSSVLRIPGESMGLSVWLLAGCPAWANTRTISSRARGSQRKP